MPAGVSKFLTNSGPRPGALKGFGDGKTNRKASRKAQETAHIRATWVKASRACPIHRIRPAPRFRRFASARYRRMAWRNDLGCLGKILQRRWDMGRGVGARPAT